MVGLSGRYSVREREGRSVPISYDEALHERALASSAGLVDLGVAV